MKRLAMSIAAALAIAAPTAALAQSGKPGEPPLTAAFLVGRWGDNGDCAKFVIIRSDGTFLSYTGGEGSWRLSGDRLVFSGSNGDHAMRVRREGNGTMVITNPDGSIGRSQRC
jgi:hypothetical protein